MLLKGLGLMQQLCCNATLTNTFSGGPMGCAGKLPLGLSNFATPLTVVHELATNTTLKSFVRMSGSDDSKDTVGGLLVQPHCMRSAMQAVVNLLLLVSQTAFHMQPCALARRSHGRDQAITCVLDHGATQGW